MNIPTGWRKLAANEVILASDEYQDKTTLKNPKRVSETLSLSSWIGKTVDSRMDFFTRQGFEEGAWQILRKIDSPWISVKESLPKKGTWNFVKRGDRDLKCGSEYFSVDKIWDATQDPFTGYVTHWMPIPELPEPIIPPITIQEGGRTHELIFNKDGSIKAGCVTIDKEKMTQIVERWKKEQE